MWQAIGSILQILFIVLKNKFEKDEEERKKKKELYEEAKTAIVNRDAAGVDAVLRKLRTNQTNNPPRV